MTPEEWKSLIERTSLAGLVPKMTLRYADYVTGPTVVITREVRDVVDGLLKEISVAYALPASTCPWTPSAFLRFYVEQNLSHEVAEHYAVDGLKIFHPHGGA